MKEVIADAIDESIKMDKIVHINVTLEEGEDIYDIVEGTVCDDMVQLEHGEWDVWGRDPDEWRLHIYLV